MSNTDKLREFVTKLSGGFYVETNLIKLTALISEHYYPKEFVEWIQQNTDHTYEEKWYVYKLHAADKDCFLTTNELFNYWKENEQ